MSNSTTIDANDLFAAASSTGEIRPSTATLLNPLGKRINQRLTPIPKKPGTRRKTFVGILLDNTQSMFTLGTDPTTGKKIPNIVTASEGANIVFNALKGFKHAATLECSLGLIYPAPDYISKLTGGAATEFSWTGVASVPQLVLGWDPKSGEPVTNTWDQAGLLIPAVLPKGVKLEDLDNALCCGPSTPLYRSYAEFEGSLIAQCQAWEDAHQVQTSSLTLVVSDGENNVDEKFLKACNELNTDINRSEKHRVFFAGLQTPGVDYHAIAAGMGILKKNVIVIPRDPKAVRAVFELFSQTTEEHSQVAAAGGTPNTAAGFSSGATSSTAPDPTAAQ